MALTLLSRSLSNFRAALLLARQSHVMEARTLVRCLYENQLWIGALRERGEAFVEEMIQDEAYNRSALATLTLKLTSKHGGDVNSADSLTLRDIVKDHAKRFPRQNKLQASKTAAAGVVELSYVEYMRFSLDAVHCSVTALGRHLSHEKTADSMELLVSVEANTTVEEQHDTILHACNALLGTAVAANELLGFTSASEQLARQFDEFRAAGWFNRI
ncbi:DUF5677 domain-containing protein [Bradyrhizobium sp. USDA 336]|uniref:DUF5677 domain-containing protein n=1 Tax=Bradyrhizobium sp. USDA 336 TaxID=3156311 RepID=UPI003833BE4A